MATQITNQATLNYTSGTDALSTSSNTARVTMQGPLEVSKYSLENAYQIGEHITYNVFLTNTSANALNDVRIEDDLGTYALSLTKDVTPLTYIGPAKVFINNVYSETVTGTVSAAKDSVTFAITTLGAGNTLLLEYETVVNEFAGAEVGTSTIHNTAFVTATGVNNPVTAESTLPVASYAAVSIEKSMSPDPVVDGSLLTYTFHITNHGTIDATDVVLRDAFAPAPDINSVSVNGAGTSEYSYATGTFQYPGAASTVSYSIAAATFTQDPATGVVTVVPGRSTIVIQGTI